MTYQKIFDKLDEKISSLIRSLGLIIALLFGVLTLNPILINIMIIITGFIIILGLIVLALITYIYSGSNNQDSIRKIDLISEALEEFSSYRKDFNETSYKLVDFFNYLKENHNMKGYLERFFTSKLEGVIRGSASNLADSNKKGSFGLDFQNSNEFQNQFTNLLNLYKEFYNVLRESPDTRRVFSSQIADPRLLEIFKTMSEIIKTFSDFIQRGSEYNIELNRYEEIKFEKKITTKEGIACRSINVLDNPIINFEYYLESFKNNLTATFRIFRRDIIKKKKRYDFLIKTNYSIFGLILIGTILFLISDINNVITIIIVISIVSGGAVIGIVVIAILIKKARVASKQKNLNDFLAS